MSNAQLILAIETSVGPCSVAIMQGSALIAEETIDDFHQQSRMLVPMCEFVLKKASLQYTDLDGIASSCGPGSFTSIRVGLAAAKAIAFAAGKPFYGVSTLEALAFAVKDSSLPILAALNAHRSEVYVQAFEVDGESMGDAIVAPVSALRELFSTPAYLLVGNHQDALAEAFPKCTQSNITTPSAIMVGALVANKLDVAMKTTFLSSPVYIRPPDAKLPSNAGA